MCEIVLDFGSRDRGSGVLMATVQFCWSTVTQRPPYKKTLDSEVDEISKVSGESGQV